MRRSTLQVFLVVAFLAMIGRSAAAQDVVVFRSPIDSAGQGGAVAFAGDSRDPELGLIAVEPFDTAKPVMGAPYTAEAVTESTQVLADGNRIERRTSAAIARDSRGRIRREHQAMVFGALMAKGNGSLVTISDPATGLHVTLDQERRVAHRMKTPKFDVLMRGDVEVAVPPGFAGGHVTKRGPSVRRDVRSEQLGEREIEGVRAEGTRTTMTIPADAIGNQLPIQIVSERWYSPELQVIVLTRRSDPRFGETVYRLTNIVRAEPAADLFEVPSDYRTEEPRMMPAKRVKP